MLLQRSVALKPSVLSHSGVLKNAFIASKLLICHLHKLVLACYPFHQDCVIVVLLHPWFEQLGSRFGTTAVAAKATCPAVIIQKRERERERERESRERIVPTGSLIIADALAWTECRCTL